MDKPKIAGITPIRVEVEAGQKFSWCTCGLSDNQPYCNGAHKGTSFRPMGCEAAETKTVSLCTCKQTKNAPYCDGAHRDCTMPE